MNDWGQVVRDLHEHYGTLVNLSRITGINKSTLSGLKQYKNAEPKHSTGEIILAAHRKIQKKGAAS